MTKEIHNTLISSLISIQKKIDKVNKIFVILMLACMVVIVSVNVFMRYILNLGLRWTQDIIILFFFYLIFFSIPIAFRSGSHVRIVFFTNKLSEKARDIFKFVVDIIILFSFILVLFMSIGAIKSIGNSPYGALKYPMSFFYYGVVISCFLIFFDFIIKIFIELKRLLKEQSTEQ